MVSHLTFILNNAIEGHEVDSIYIDYAKAFDKVDHGLLVKKLLNYGINNKFLAWLKNFLSNRSQTVFANNAFSYKTQVKSGVPQGSVLGPLLFIVYINDLSTVLNAHENSCRVFTFADDTKLVSKVSSCLDQAALQSTLNDIQNWSASNNMSLNDKKFELLIHGLGVANQNKILMSELPFNQCFHTYSTPNCCIYPSSTVRDLGVFLDNKLDFKTHYNTIYKKAKQLSAWAFNTFYTRAKEPMFNYLQITYSV